MALFKDGKVYRTIEEQIVHLTNAHETQLKINEDINKELQEISVASNLGGYNLVRFSFEKQGTFYRFSSNSVSSPVSGDVGDYFEITSGNNLDIPAYGYLNNNNVIILSYLGDFTENYSTLTFRNVTKNVTSEKFVSLSEFSGSSLMDYNPNERKKQLFNVLNDLSYGTRTQYVSFDLNNDGIFNFVFIGINVNGKDGRGIYATNGIDYQNIKNVLKQFDLLLITTDNPNISDIPNASRGQVYIYNGLNSYSLKGSILGQKGDKGVKGDTGEQGIQGIQGVQGNTGQRGEKGDKGEPGQSIKIFTGIYNSVSELPQFSSTSVGDGYRVINTSGAIVTYDLYFHAENGTDWDIQPNWGGIKGDKGDTGDRGEQGIQGVQGIQGADGVANILNVYPIGSIYMSVLDTPPDLLFGGVWEKIEGRFLLSSSNDFTLGSVGGEKEHKLSIEEMPSHEHHQKGSDNQYSGYDIVYKSAVVGTGNTYGIIMPTGETIQDGAYYVLTGKAGESKSHNNMPPYLTVNMWKRIS